MALIRRQVPDVDRFIAVSEYCAPFMAELLGIPAARIAVVPLGINLTGYERAAGGRPAQTPSASATSRGSRPRRDCTCSPRPTSRFRRTHGTTRRCGSRPPATWRRRSRRISTASSATLERRGLAGEFTYHGAVDRDGQAGVSARARRAVGAGDLRRAEGRVPARGDGERRARGAAAARRVHRDRREDRRRPARRRRTTRSARRRSLRAVERPRAGRRARRARRSTASARTTAIQQSADRLLEVYRGDARSAANVGRRSRALRC